MIHGVVFFGVCMNGHLGYITFLCRKPQSYIAQMVGISSWWPF